MSMSNPAQTGPAAARIGCRRADGTAEPKSDYIADDYRDSRLIHYDDLFEAWEQLLEFQVNGKDP